MTMTLPESLAAPVSTHHALIIGKGTLAEAVAHVLQSRNITFDLRDSFASEDDLHGASIVFNLWYPNPKSDGAQAVSDYSRQLLESGMTCGQSLAGTAPAPAIINFAFLPAIYVGTELEDHVGSLRGAITGVTRTLARRFGKSGVRVTCVQAGLVDMPETQEWVSELVKAVQVPTKRWATPTEVAKFMVFLAVDSLYTTGQTMIIDGGLTAGITGT